MKRDEALLLMLAGLLAGCKSTSEFGHNEGRINQTRVLIEKHVADAEQSKAMQTIVDSYEQAIKKIESDALSLRSQITEANRDFDAPDETLENSFAKLGELTSQLGETAKKHSLELKALCSEQEWKQIASHKTEAVHFTF